MRFDAVCVRHTLPRLGRIVGFDEGNTWRIVRDEPIHDRACVGSRDSVVCVYKQQRGGGNRGSYGLRTRHKQHAPKCTEYSTAHGILSQAVRRTCVRRTALSCLRLLDRPPYTLIA